MGGDGSSPARDAGEGGERQGLRWPEALHPAQSGDTQRGGQAKRASSRCQGDSFLFYPSSPNARGEDAKLLAEAARVRRAFNLVGTREASTATEQAEKSALPLTRARQHNYEFATQYLSGPFVLRLPVRSKARQRCSGYRPYDSLFNPL